jgi:two-component system response regulator HupR/HoxA
MINWDEFEHIHVIKKLKQILQSWWNIDIIFTDERGHVRGPDLKGTHQVNPAVKLFLSKESAAENLSEVVAKSMDEVRQSGNRFTMRKWDMAGFDLAIVPIIIENEFMGNVVAMGFLKDADVTNRLNEIRERLAAFGANAEVIEGALGKVKAIEDQDREHFMQLVELVAQEVVTLHLEITSRENRIRELNKELGSRYKYDNMIGKSKPMQSLYNLLD